MPSHSAAERQALADALAEAGPGAATLCAGWTTTDLATHLVLREGRPQVRLAGAVGPLRSWAIRQEETTRARPYAELISRIRNGPPRTSPFALPGVDQRANLLEHFVHCEDVRRAVPDWQPRELPADRQNTFWKTLSGALGKLALRKSEVPVSLQVPGGEPVAIVRRPGPGVTVAGPPGELAMYLFGRKEHARVQLLGEEDAVARFRDLSLRV
jgi:uncharacterized protein (TIGR03085 family)